MAHKAVDCVALLLGLTCEESGSPAWRGGLTGLGATPGSHQPGCSELAFLGDSQVQQHQDPESHADLMPISLQGLFVLLFHCVTHREVRKHLRAVLAGKKLHLDDSAATRATLLTVRDSSRPRSWQHCLWQDWEL